MSYTVLTNLDWPLEQITVNAASWEWIEDAGEERIEFRGAREELLAVMRMEYVIGVMDDDHTVLDEVFEDHPSAADDRDPIDDPTLWDDDYDPAVDYDPRWWEKVDGIDRIDPSARYTGPDTALFLGGDQHGNEKLIPCSPPPLRWMVDGDLYERYLVRASWVRDKLSLGIKRGGIPEEGEYLLYADVEYEADFLVSDFYDWWKTP